MSEEKAKKKLTRRTKNMIAALTAFALIVAIFVPVYMNLGDNLGNEDETASEISSETTSTEKVTVDIYTEKVSDFVSATINAVDSGTYTLQKTSDGYEIPELDGVGVYPAMLETFAENMSDFKGYQLVAENVTDYSVYGLDQPTATGTFNFTDTTHTISVGDETGDGYFYVTADNSGKVYKATTGIRMYFVYGAMNFVNLSIFSCAEDYRTNIDKLRIVNPTDTLFMEKLEESDGTAASYTSTYILREPFYASTDAELLDTGFEQLISVAAVNAYSFVTDEKLTECGLDAPTRRLSFEYDTVDDDGNVTDTDKYSFVFGNLNSDGDCYYGMQENGKIIYEFPLSNMEYLEWTTQEVSSSILLTPMLSWLETLTVTTPEATYVFEITSDGTETTAVSCNHKELDLDNFKKYYNVLVGTSRYELTEPAEGEVLAEPTIKVVFDFNDEKSNRVDTISYIKQNDRKYYAEVNGEIYCNILKTRIDKLIQDTQKVLNGEEITSFIY